MSGRLHSVNVGTPREVVFGDELILTSIWKEPVDGPVPVRGVNVDGDDQADRSVHGGPDKSVYAYAIEDLRWWAIERGTAISAGYMGENLTAEGIDVTAAVVGEVWEVGTARLQVSQARMPCFKLGLRAGDPSFPREFARAGRPGAYLRIVQAGVVAAGDRIDIVERPTTGPTVGDIARAYHYRDRAPLTAMAESAYLTEAWRRWAVERLART
ncbi:MAG: MOSC domain-containing protein [Candidatus Nanopelagicales bacterium]